jgi:sigma-B regulation protein RsbU (phosphoserine phosphatase)
MVKSRIAGVLLFGRPLNRERYGSAERRALRSAGSQFALLLENGRLTGRVVEQERLKRELQVATEVQKRLFPDKFPETAAVHCAGLCLPARGVGGDYFDFLDLGNQQIGIALADVAGKGIAAALIMSVVQASLRSLAETSSGSLGDLAGRMNRLLHRSTGSNSYATFFYSQFDETTRQLRYVNAGHNPPYLLRSADDSIEELAAGGTIIGMFAQSRYEEATVNLKSGDVLIAFTDGVSEAQSPTEEEFGEDRLKDALRRAAHLPVSEMASSILDELRAWMADAEQFDDLTFIVMKVR